VSYSLLLSSLLAPHGDDFDYLLALMPIYWIGYGVTGLSGLLRRKNRQDVCAVWGNLVRYRYVIVVAEIMGALVYLFEVQAFHELRPEMVNLIIGANVVVVFTLSLLLAGKRRRLEGGGHETFRALGITVKTTNLPDTVVSRKKVLWLILVLLALGAAIFGIATPL